jgi:tight adherence protein C
MRLSEAGFRNEGAVGIFLGLKFIGLIVGLTVSGAATLLTGSYTQSALIYAVVVVAFMFYLPDIAVWFVARHRKDSIFMGLPDVLDLLVVCVEAGLGLDQAMRKVSEEMKKSARVVSDEFALCNFQLQMGRARNEVLQDLGGRTGVDDLRSLAAILIQADKFGSSIAQALRVQSDSMRTRRRQLAEEKAAKTAVKLIFPLVIFIFPAIFVVLVGPAAITIVNEMFPMMNGTK